jgi:hypothetical protein
MKHSTRSAFVTVSVLLSVCILAFASNCYADFATPFVEVNNKLGDVSTTQAYVLTLGPQSTNRFMVVVMTDTRQYEVYKATPNQGVVMLEKSQLRAILVLQATAKEGVVKDSLLGREVLLKATIAKAGSWKTLPELEILEVEALPSARPSEPGKKL